MKKVFVSLVIVFCLLFAGIQGALALQTSVIDPNNGANPKAIDPQNLGIPKAPSNQNYVCTGAGVVTVD